MIIKSETQQYSVLGGWLIACCIALVVACGGGGSGSASETEVPVANNSGDGELIIGITDAEGDFLSYVVDVTSLTLAKANGTVVETLPLSTRIDFAQLTEVTEFLSIATVPEGVYESVVISLDYANAEIVVQNELGDAVSAVPVDANGTPVSQFDVRLMLTSTDVIRIAPGVPAAFSLDFDLDASNEIDLAATPVTVIVDPVLLAMPELEVDRSHRVRGLLALVDETADEFTLRVRPFRHRNGEFGRAKVAVDEETHYEVDGELFIGSAGLTAMNNLPDNAPVIAQGTVSDKQIIAEQVLAGTSVAWTDSDVVRGVVIARDNDALTVGGARLEYADGTDIFRGTFTIRLGADTKVTSLLSSGENLTINAISVGQRISAVGELVDDTTMDAGAGRIRLLMNQLSAEVVQASPLAVDLLYLNGRRPLRFDFSGTGMSTLEDADADFYEIDTSELALSTISNGDLIKVRGLVNDFGFAPEDFNAHTVIDVQTLGRGSVLGVHWPEASTNPFNSISTDRIEIDLVEPREVLKIGGLKLMLDTLDAIALVTPDTGRGIYAISVRGESQIHLYRQFEDLVTELNRQLDAGNLLQRVGAHGRYNSANKELTTRRANFRFITPTPQ